jgi:hypothetical protein
MDDNALINQLLVLLEAGHEVGTETKIHSFVFCEPVSVASSWQNFLASSMEKLGHRGKKYDPLEDIVIFYFFNVSWTFIRQFLSKNTIYQRAEFFSPRPNFMATLAGLS